jgi:hypothetical protein
MAGSLQNLDTVRYKRNGLSKEVIAAASIIKGKVEKELAHSFVSSGIRCVFSNVPLVLRFKNIQMYWLIPAEAHILSALNLSD